MCLQSTFQTQLPVVATVNLLYLLSLVAFAASRRGAASSVAFVRPLWVRSVEKKPIFQKGTANMTVAVFFFLLFPGLSDNIHRIFVSYGSSPSSTLLWCPQRKRKQMINTNSGGVDHTRRLSRRTCSVIPAISAGIFLPEIDTMWIRTLNQLPLHAVVDFVLSHQLSSPTAAVGRHADSPETSSLRWKVYSWEEAGTVCPCRLVFPAGTATRQDLTSRLRQVWMWLGSIYPPGALRK